MTNSEVREWYLARAAEIPKLNQQWISQKVSLENTPETLGKSGMMRGWKRAA
jgi:hypothetical protein